MEIRTAGERRVDGVLAAVMGIARNPRVRLALAVVAFAAVTLVTYLIAHPRMFTGFASYDDEGYMLIALKEFIRHGHLYNQVFSQYGPFYYEFWGGLFSLFGISVTHDAGRMVTLMAWVLSGLVAGVSVMRMCRSIILGLAVQILVFQGIGTLTTEPMHPGGIICLLLVTIIAISCGVRARTSVGAMATLGGAVAALILVKINVGMFALAAVVLTCVASYQALASRRWLRLVVEIGFVAVPVMLMTAKFGEAWARHYAVHVAVAALAVVIALRARSTGRRSPEELWWFGGGLIVVSLTICFTIFAVGTSPSGLIDGVLKQPLRQAGAFWVPLQLSNRIYVFDLLALMGALVYWYVTRRNTRLSPTWRSITSLLSILIGLEMALSVVGKTILFDAPTFTGYQLSLLAFAWVALIQVPGESDKRIEFARILLPPLAVLQALHAYPVAGSQIQWSAFLQIPVGAICVANGVRGLALGLTGEVERRGMAVIGAIAATMMALVLVNTQLRQPLREARAAYNGAVPLDLPGATAVHLSQPEVELYRNVSSAIDTHCRSLVMLPGMNSFYFWTGLEPPTGYNATGWPTLFDEAHQHQVIDETRSIEGLCQLRNTLIAKNWGNGTVPPGSLVRYLHRGFRPIIRFGEYKLLKREGVGPPS